MRFFVLNPRLRSLGLLAFVLIFSGVPEVRSDDTEVLSVRSSWVEFKKVLAQVVPGSGELFLPKEDSPAKARRQPTYGGVVSPLQVSELAAKLGEGGFQRQPADKLGLAVKVSVDSTKAGPVWDIEIQGKDRRWTTASSVYPGQFVLMTEPAPESAEGFSILLVAPKMP